MVICAAYALPKQKWQRKGKRKFDVFSIPYPRINTEKKDLLARWLFNVGTGWTVNSYTLSEYQNVGHGR